MIVKVDGKNIVLDNVKDFDLAKTLECGQCFRFRKIDDFFDGVYNVCEYIIIAYGKMLRIKQEKFNLIRENNNSEANNKKNNNCNVKKKDKNSNDDNNDDNRNIDDRVTLFNTSKEEFDNIWSHYFDFETDYEYINNAILKIDSKLSDAISSMHGVRILNQEFFETLISFIISQNKQIPHIMKIVESISERYGDVCGEYQGKKFYSFPTVDRLCALTEDDFRKCKTGFRAPYIIDAIKKVSSGEILYDDIKQLDTSMALDKLMCIKGVGSKVANCVCLFCFHMTDSFPVDVWIKRIMQDLYFDGKDMDKNIIESFGKEKFGDLCGYAQQYLFYYARENGNNSIKKNKKVRKKEKK